MSIRQIGSEFFPGICRQVVSIRLTRLTRNAFLERRVLTDSREKDIAAFLNTAKALNEIRDSYDHQITSELCKSDSMEHDISLVDIRKRLQSITCVKKYLTENMLQGCKEFEKSESILPFVRNNTDAVLELVKNDQKILIGLEFENSEKSFERYTRKLLSYYSDFRTPIIFYICANPRTIKVIAQAESEIMGSNKPRCFYALLENVLDCAGNCVFTDLAGETITLS